MATVQKKKRSKKTLERLEAQLASGLKPARVPNEKHGRKYKTTNEKVPLTEKDKERIKTQIAILQKAIS